jgi:hypothetical protein
MLGKRIRTLRRAIARATPQIRRPAIVGAIVLSLLGLLAFLGIWRTDLATSMPSALQGQAVSYAVWGLKPSNLLMVLPIGAFLVVLARSFIGMKAFGLFTPMLIALAFLQIGPLFGPLVLVSAIGVGMVVAPALMKLRMTRVGFLGVLISFVTLVLAGLQEVLDENLQVDAFPVVVTALCVERWWKNWDKDGAWKSAQVAFNTVLLAMAIQFVMVSPIAIMLMDISPLVLPALAAVAITILGRYRGLRLTEIARFAPLWLEGRRYAKAQEADEEAEIEREPEPPDKRKNPREMAEGKRAESRPAARPVKEPEVIGQSGGYQGRRPGYQPPQRPDRQVQPPQSDRPRQGQGRGEDALERVRYRHYRHDLRRLRLWGSD